VFRALRKIITQRTVIWMRGDGGAVVLGCSSRVAAGCDADKSSHWGAGPFLHIEGPAAHFLTREGYENGEI
jgi:hypothetical protein